MKQNSTASKMELSGEINSSVHASPVITVPSTGVNADQATVILNPFFRKEGYELKDYRFLAYVRTGTGDVGALSLALSVDGEKWLWWAAGDTPSENDPVPVLGPPKGSAQRRINSPHAVADYAAIYLWYSPNDGSTYTIRKATTTNGYDFTSDVEVLAKGESGRFDSWTVQAASAVTDYNDVTKMWYIGATNVNGKEYYLGLAEYDADGKLLTRTTEPLFPTAEHPLPAGIKRIGFPRVIRYKKQYLMFFCGASASDKTDWQVYAAVSKDGKEWTLLSQEPVLARGGENSWNEFSVYSPSVLARGLPYDTDGSDTLVFPPNVLFMYFGGNNVNTEAETKPLLAQTGLARFPFSEIMPAVT